MTRIAAVLALILLVLSTLVSCGGSGIPQAKFSASPKIGRVPLDVQFTDKSTGNVSVWEWDLNGDGFLDSTMRNPKYTYESIGNYTVTLTVLGSKGNDTEVKKGYIEILRCPYLADFEIKEPLPENCQVQGNTTSCIGTTTIYFIDKSAGNVTAWDWDFDNNGTIDSTDQNPSHVYSRNGNYSVTLTITTPECRDTVTKWDYINLAGCSS